MGVDPVSAAVGASAVVVSELLGRRADKKQRAAQNDAQRLQKSAEAEAVNEARLQEEAALAAEEQRKKGTQRAIKGGRAATIATSPLGLSEINPANVRKTTLLGT